MSYLFEVWAPHASMVEVIVEDQRFSMDPSGGGWWEVAADAQHGSDYRFAVDGSDPLPDPRSPWQPQGVQGPSRALDHRVYNWAVDTWTIAGLADAVIYELHIGTFTETGTFEAAVDRLDHLVELGITHVELLPVAEFPGTRGWGYDGADLYAPHHAYGGPEGLKTLVDACHARGLAVILDVVYNHLGPDGNYLGRFGPYFTDRYATPWGQAINFDGPESDEVRAFFVDNALMWLRDYRFDGLRLDAVHAILDTSAVHILEELAAAVAELHTQGGRELFLIAESDLNDPRILAGWPGGFGMDAQWSDDLHHSLHALLTGERDGYYADFGSVAQLAKALQQAFVYDGMHSTFRRRRHGRQPRGLPGSRFLGYLQNHDQIGNRATGDRSSALMSTDLLKVGAALVLTSPFEPMLFQGEEWGASTPFRYFTDHNQELGRAVTKGRKREFAAFGWPEEQIPDPQDPATFEASKIDWDEIERAPHDDLLRWHKELIALRANEPALRDGRMDLVRCEYDEDARWLIVRRGPITIACNFSETDATLEIRDPGAILIASSAPDIAQDKTTLAAESVVVWKRAD